MKKLIFILFFPLAAFLSACTTTSTIQPLPIASVQQVVASFCPTVNADLSVLSTSPTVSPVLQAQFKTLASANKYICSMGSTMTVTDLQTLNTSVVQVAIGLLMANPALPGQPAILLGLQLGAPLI
ncbi:MAG: hypothetical protein ACREQ5_33305, partial [Candidatus Dormibacteria bacterium]